MPYKGTPQTFNATINTVVIGTGDAAVTLGGENVMPLYSFDAPIQNRPAIGVEVEDAGLPGYLPALGEFYAGAETVVDQVVRAAQMDGADFVVLKLASADPNGQNASVEDCVALAREVAAACPKRRCWV